MGAITIITIIIQEVKTLIAIPALWMEDIFFWSKYMKSSDAMNTKVGLLKFNLSKTLLCQSLSSNALYIRLIKRVIRLRVQQKIYLPISPFQTFQHLSFRKSYRNQSILTSLKWLKLTTDYNVFLLLKNISRKTS